MVRHAHTAHPQTPDSNDPKSTAVSRNPKNLPCEVGAENRQLLGGPRRQNLSVNRTGARVPQPDYQLDCPGDRPDHDNSPEHTRRMALVTSRSRELGSREWWEQTYQRL